MSLVVGWRWVHRWSTEDFYSSETALYDTIMLNTCHYIIVQPPECIISRVSPTINDGYWVIMMYQVALVVKNPPTNAVDVKNDGSIPGPGRSPGGAHGNPLQYSGLENPMDRRDWWATVHSVTKSRTWKATQNARMMCQGSFTNFNTCASLVGMLMGICVESEGMW